MDGNGDRRIETGKFDSFRYQEQITSFNLFDLKVNRLDLLKTQFKSPPV